METYDIIIVGGGPAGLTAAIYAARANKKTLVLETMTCGGQIVNSSRIDNYPAAPHISGAEFGQILCKQTTDIGADIEYECVTRIEQNGYLFTVTTEDSKYSARSVILATGTKARKLDLDGTDELVGKGISYCATCDGNFYKDKVVAVYGGGNTAAQEAIYLSDIAKKVYLIHRRMEFRAEKSLIDKALKKGVTTVNGLEITHLKRKNDKLSGITLRGGLVEYEIDGLFVSIGREPNAKDLMSGLEFDDGYIASDESCKTNIPGVFVAGDVRKKALRQLVTATADGAIAASAAIEYLK